MSKRLGQIKFTDEAVKDIKAYVTDGVLPVGSAAALRRFRARCAGFKVINGRLMYDREGTIIPVILPDQVEATLKRFERLACVEILFGVAINIPWVVLLYFAQQNLEYNPTVA